MLNILAIFERKHHETLKTLIMGAMKNSCPALAGPSFGRVSEMPSKCSSEVPNLLLQKQGFHFTVRVCLVRRLGGFDCVRCPEGKGC